MEYSRLVRTLIGLFRQNKIPYMIVGGLAVNYWGMPRATFDIDLVIALQPQDIPQLVQPMRALRYRTFLETVSMNAAMAGEPAVVTPEDLAGAQAIERNTHHDGQVGCSITKPKDGARYPTVTDRLVTGFDLEDNDVVTFLGIPIFITRFPVENVRVPVNHRVSVKGYALGVEL